MFSERHLLRLFLHFYVGNLTLIFAVFVIHHVDGIVYLFLNVSLQDNGFVHVVYRNVLIIISFIIVN